MEKETFNHGIGQRLAHFRKSNQLTQTDLAKLLSTSQGRVSAVEKGLLDFVPLWFDALVEKYRLNPMFLLGYSKNLYLSQIKKGYNVKDKMPFLESPVSAVPGVGDEE